MTGSGNDFVFLDAREPAGAPERWPPARIRQVCSRRTGVGADGLVILAPAGPPGQVSMLFFNSDGSRGAMCGNAALCATRLAHRLGMSPGEMELVTDAGTFAARLLGDPSGHRAELNLPDFEAPVRVDADDMAPGEEGPWAATVGVPHAVVLVEAVGRVALERRGPALRAHPALGLDGANANFASPLEAAGPGQPAWAMRTWERGVEGETLACGTGAVAVAAVLAMTNRAALPIGIQTRSGLVLSVDLTQDGPTATNVWLGGEGRLVYQGHLAGS